MFYLLIWPLNVCCMWLITTFGIKKSLPSYARCYRAGGISVTLYCFKENVFFSELYFINMCKLFGDSKRYLEDYHSDCLLVIFRSRTGCLKIFFSQMCPRFTRHFCKWLITLGSCFYYIIFNSSSLHGNWWGHFLVSKVVTSCCIVTK